MKISCQACSAKYTIADDKVRGRKVKIRCKGCATPIVVDGQNAEADSEIQGVADTSSDGITADGMPEWSVNLSETDSRTMTVDEIAAGWKSGLVTADAFVWKDGMADWIPILECDELKPHLASAPAAPKPASSPTATTQLFGSPKPGGSVGARLAPQRAQDTADLFGGVDSASVEGEITTSVGASIPSPMGRAEDKPTGQRNENSVLFSLDALKAGFAGPKVESSPPPRQHQVSNPDDPFGMGSTGGVFGLGGGGLNLSSNQALLTAPAPEPPKPAQPMPSLDLGALAQSPPSAPASNLPALLKNKKVVMAAAAGGALLLIIGIAAAFSGGDKQDKQDELAATGEASARAASDTLPSEKPAEPEEKKQEAKPEEPVAKQEEEKKEEPEANKEEEAEAKKEETKTAALAPKSGSKTTTAKKEEPAPAATAPFSKAAAISALSSAASSAASCKKPGGPKGSGKVQVTFAPSGRVTSASVQGGGFSGTSVGNCVAAVFRRAKVPAFSGSAVTVSKSFSIK